MAYPDGMGGRIEEGYRRKLRALLARVRPRRLDFGVDLCLRRARELAEREGIPAAAALARVYEFTRWRVQRRLEVTGACAVEAPLPAPLRFLCDGSAGGLARWLRAAGYEADWRAGRAGEALVSEAAAGQSVLVTTDSGLLARAEGTPVIVWVPSGMDPASQAGVVLRDLMLTPRAPRCMACGGALESVAKEAVSERIPPRTARWKDEYFVCGSCGRLFWQGTHWERIRARLDRERPAPADPSRP
jgi:uncharacterized protein with PIN domain